MDSKAYTQYLKTLISQDQLEVAVRELGKLLQDSPQLNEAILQSGRLKDLAKQVRLGQLTFEQSGTTRNQIRAGLLELVNEVEGKKLLPQIHKEIDHYAGRISGKNIVVGNIQAGGNVTIGDQVQQLTESKTSRNVRLFLLVFVPVLAIALALFYIRYQQLRKPLSLAVSIHNTTPNPNLPFPGGTITLQYDGKSESRPIEQDVVFRGIPPNFRKEQVQVRFEAPGFVTVDTSVILQKEDLRIPIRRDDTFAKVFGVVQDEETLQPLEAVTVSIGELSTQTDQNGQFNLSIPFEKQRTQQRLQAIKSGYKAFDRTEPVIKNEETRISLQKMVEK